ncbi:MAG: efflux RND transporter permease subunit [Desulfobacterium sp.]|jgi:HAE1 family hydrophobic/amphiphilic exporter-1|nr:efflux RND transporter permease subunit [Desulfobacterium sp.]
MNVIEIAIKRPVTTAVMVILIVLFGVIGLTRLPVQLAPDTDLPEIEVMTVWPGASPTDMESEVVEKQEDKLKSLQNLQKMESSSYNDYATITLTFDLSTDIDTALFRVSNKLNEVDEYPDNVKRPILSSSGGSSQPIIWMVMKTIEGEDFEILKQRTFFENEIRQYLERVEGVASLLVFGGTENQLEIIIDPERMTQRGITINQIISKVTAANKDVSAGVLGIDRRNYRIRTVAKFQDSQDPLDVVVYDDGIKRVFLRDVATSQIGTETQIVSVMDKGREGIVIGVRKQKGANVIEIVNKVRAEVDRLNRDVLAEKNLLIDWSHDQAPYILTSIGNMKKNVIIGASLAITVLVIFLGSIRSTATIGLAIPISAIGTFIFLWLFNRNLNVVSLAGISFAVGMLVDNSIVVLENIDRQLQTGKSIFDAVLQGANEVFGAVIASTLTTVAVFLPVIFIKQEAGQLFKDIAIAITSSILLSLLVSVTVIPSFMHFLYKNKKVSQGGRIQALIGSVGGFFVSLLMGVSNFFQKNVVTRMVCILTFTSLAVGSAWILMPKAEYLPQGNQNFIMNILVPPPGYSAEKRREVGEYLFEQTAKYNKPGDHDMPLIKNMFYFSSDFLSGFGLSATDEYETEAKRFIPMLTGIINSLPGMFGISIQPGIFESGIGKGRTVDLNISGEEMNEIVTAGKILFGAVAQAVPGSQIRPVPSLEISYPEGRVVADKMKLAASGLNEEDLGVYVDVLMTGRKVSEFGPEGKDRIDLVVRGAEAEFKTPEDILNAPIVNNIGRQVRIGDVAAIEYGSGMTQIDRLEKKRNVRLEITPPVSIPLQTAIETIQSTCDDLLASGQIKNVTLDLGGNADKLEETFNALKWNLLLALMITYLLMAALFENFLYPFIIMFSVPLAAAGGLVGLRLVDAFIAPQPLDVLTMLGFIILIGAVVNNAILIVHQSLNNVRNKDMEGMKAISESVRTRIRPIYMSAFTSIFGLMPLVVATGSGSELYRGIGSVLLGGLAVSAIFTLFVIPALLAFFIGFEKSRVSV